MSGRPRSFAPGENAIAASFALWGLAIAIALIHFWKRPAPFDQLPGFAKANGFDAHGPFLWIAGLIVLPLLLPLLLAPVTRRLRESRLWARNAVVAAPLAALWLATIGRDPLAALAPAVVIAVAFLLRDRDMRFTRSDVVLLPVFLTALLATIDVAPRLPLDRAVALTALLLFVLRIGIASIGSNATPALAFIAAPLGLLLQTSFFARDQRYFGWHALAIVVLTPFALRLLAGKERSLRKLLVFVVYPLALYCYSNAMSIQTAEGKPRIDFFEDGHSLLPASEYLGGELPYRDTQPAHGLMEDGLFDFLSMRAGGEDAGTRSKARFTIGNLTTVALYAAAFAATGSAEGAFFAVLLSIMTGAFRMQVRFVPPLITLALIANAVRRRRPQQLRSAGALSVVCGLTSLDTALYTFLTLVLAVARFPGPKRAAWRAAAAGIAVAVIPLFAGLAVLGIADDFFRTTFVETLVIGPAYTLDFFTPSRALEDAPGFPEALRAVLDPQSYLIFFWCAATLFAAVMLRRRAARRTEPLVLFAFWIVISAISYAERHHLYFAMLAAVMIVAAVLSLLRRRSVLALPAIAALIVLAMPTTHLGVVSWMRRARGPVDAAWGEISNLPRARGALFHQHDVAVIESVRRYLSLSLAHDETFLDFTNSGILFFLTGRDNPIREYEVAFYQTEEKQREVIRRIERDPRIRAVLVPVNPAGRFSVDGIPNSTRAPLVWHFLQQNFTPDFEEGEVAFWRRKVP